MTRGLLVASVVVALAVRCCIASAQAMPSVSYGEEGNDNPQGNVHVGAPIVIPLNPTARVVHLGFGLNIGGGYNFNRKHGVVGEYLWNDLLPTNGALANIRTALNDQSINARARVMALTGNYRYEWRKQHLGTYFLGGAGLYYRQTSLSKKVTTSTNIACTPVWLWEGFSCTQGYVTANQSIGSFATSSGGFNGGIGFTARVGEPPYRFYAEARYHYAPNSTLNLQMINITFGFRY